MMRYIRLAWKEVVWVVCLLGFSLPAAPAQQLVFTPSQLDFGVVYEDESQVEQIWIHNTGDDTLRVDGIWNYLVYGNPAFEAAPEQMTLAPGDSQQMMVIFAPRHNIWHESEIVFRTDDPRGDPVLSVRGQGRYRNGYYAGTENTAEQELKDSLKARLGRGYVSYSYNAARDEMFMVVDNQRTNGQGATVNTLEGVYTGFTVTGYTNRIDAQNQGFNTEHTFPQGFFNQDLPMRSDLYHLFPTKIAANSERGNKPFGVVSNPTWQDGGSKSNSSLFEPRDSHKGPVARAMFYFVLRYQDYANFLSSQEAILREWHGWNLPDSVEIRRNAAIAALQQNRNPLIDYPQFLDRISSVSGNSVATPERGLFSPDSVVDFGTVSAGTAPVYGLVVANTGNVPLSLSGLSLSDTRLSFVGSSGSDTLLAPGRARVLAIRFLASGPDSLAATVSLQADVPGQPAYSWPVRARVVGTDGLAPDWGRGWTLAPQPAQTRVQVLADRWPAGPVQVNLYDATGREVRSDMLTAVRPYLPVDGLAPGRYWLRLTYGGASGMWPLQVAAD